MRLGVPDFDVALLIRGHGDSKLLIELDLPHLAAMKLSQTVRLDIFVLLKLRADLLHLDQSNRALGRFCGCLLLFTLPR